MGLTMQSNKTLEDGVLKIISRWIDILSCEGHKPSGLNADHIVFADWFLFVAIFL